MKIEVKDGGPAFPCEVSMLPQTGEIIGKQTGDSTGIMVGMSLRDYFAAKALAAMIASESGSGGMCQNHVAGQDFKTLNAIDAYKWADAMLKAREQ